MRREEKGGCSGVTGRAETNIPLRVCCRTRSTASSGMGTGAQWGKEYRCLGRLWAGGDDYSLFRGAQDAVVSPTGSGVQTLGEEKGNRAGGKGRVRIVRTVIRTIECESVRNRLRINRAKSNMLMQ